MIPTLRTLQGFLPATLLLSLGASLGASHGASLGADAPASARPQSPAQAPARREASVEFQVPPYFIQGESFPVSIRIQAEDEGAPLPVWMLTSAAFSLDGEFLSERGEEKLSLLPGQKIDVAFDLAPVITSSAAFQGKKFRLGLGTTKEVREIVYLEAAQRGINFMELPEAQLGEYDVIVRTDHGDLWLEFWPDVAPNHVRNFLDLAYTGFYDDNQFHRVVPGFMIQGGSAKPSRPAPRQLEAEFNAKRHVPGVLSMARLSVDMADADGNVVSQFNSATCQFFVMHGVTPALDGKYTAFGKLVAGLPVVEEIAQVQAVAEPPSREPSNPVVRQTIEKMIVIKAPREKPQDKQ